MKEISQRKINKKIAKKKDSFRLRKADRINTSALTGLTLEQVEERKKDNLVNKKVLDKTKSLTKIILSNTFNFCNTMIIVLCIILIIMGYWDYTISSILIFVTIGMGIYQEVKAKLTVQKLSIVNQAMCDVVRGGNTYNISTEELVLDDVYILSAGQQIPVDGEVLEGLIEVDESILTGESYGVKKTTGDKILAGSIVLAGEAVSRVERVGKDCYIESISSIIKQVSRPESKLFKIIDKIIKIFGCILFILAALLIVAYRIAEKSWDETLLMTISSMLGMIPSGMFLVTSTALAQSVLKLAKTNALPQDIYSIEMLAMVDTLLLDKTGTITDGNLEVLECNNFSDKSLDEIKNILLTMDDNNKDKKPTAIALKEYAKDAKILDCIDELPFSSKRKYSAITISKDETYILGAPDFVCPNDSKMLEFCEEEAKEGKRTILLAKFNGEIDDIDVDETESICVFVLEEKLKENIKNILEWFHNNDVDIKIISGDNPNTVSAIAKKAGVYNCERAINCAELSNDELRAKCSDGVVFGRVSPEQKVLIVNELKRKKHIVGMVGDGVNDAQALKASNCSISFSNANEVARNISRIVLLDNDFSSMPKIVEEGRRVIGNIEKVSSLFIMKNIFVMFMTFVFAITLMATKTVGYPFTTKNLLMFEFFVVGIPPFIFALMPNQERSQGNFVRNIIKVSIPSAISIIFSTSLVFILNVAGVIPGDISEGSNVVSIAALAMTMSAFVCSGFISLPKNKIRIATVVVSFVLAIISAYVDYQFLGGLFLDVQIPTDAKMILILLGTTMAAFVVNLLCRIAFKFIDDKVGNDAEKLMDQISEKTKEYMKNFSNNFKKKS